MRQSLQSGLTLVEILVAMLILGIGVIATLAMQGTAKSGNLEAFQRTQAVLIARDLAERISSNRSASLDDYEGTYTGSAITSYSDCQGATSCTPTQMVSWDRYQFDQAILGASELRDDKPVGGLIAAEGCVDYSAGLLTIVITWKGAPLGAAVSSPISGCGSSISAAKRRTFVLTTYIGES